ncbi:MAG: hypothetical protein FWE20_03525 [Defluviitaleaceae bacterium]|nr:hypothetical protein [Defluviitaleaceae bacterium]
MAYETKLIMKLLARYIAKASSVKEAYSAVKDIANAEDVILPSYEEMVQIIKSEE